MASELMVAIDDLWRTPKERRAFEEQFDLEPLKSGIFAEDQISSGYYAQYTADFRGWAMTRVIEQAARAAIQAEADRLLCDNRDLGDDLNGLLSDFDADDLYRLATLVHDAVAPFMSDTASATEDTDNA